jgi:nitrous oxide reductase accessory protein NosL
VTRSAIIKRSGWLLVFVVILAACRAEEDSDQPVPTRFDADAESTQRALQITITAPPPTVELATETPGITPTDTALATVSPSEVPSIRHHPRRH